jgi:stage II sporulation protein D
MVAMKRRFFLSLIAMFVVGCMPLRSYVPTRSMPVEKREGREPVQSGKLERPIRVAIAVRLGSVRMRIPRSFRVTGLPAAEEGGRELRVTVNSLPGDKAFIRPEGAGEVWVEGKKYRGILEVDRDRNGTLTIINELSMEDYVMGVLAGEIPSSWPIEALKAQAIAARTFAVYQQGEARRKKQPYDLENTALFQMYQGSQFVNDRIRQAVSSTRGQVLTYHDAPIMALFHSNCGGKTSDSKNVWSQGQPYLKSIPCSFCEKGEHFRWRVEMAVPDLVRKLRSGGAVLSDIVQLQVLDRDESDRVATLVLMDGDGQRKKIKGATFRMAAGPDLIRSTRFDAEVRGDKIVFNGKGWGHGVGLCQEGACGMAKQGYGAFDILRHYYHGVILDQLRNE